MSDDAQLLHLVIGGEMTAPGQNTFRDIKQIEFVGAYPSFAEAQAAWKAKAQSTVDNALMRFFVIHAHKLLTPNA